MSKEMSTEKILIIEHSEQPVSVNSMTYISHGRKVNSHATNHFLKYGKEEVILTLEAQDILFLSPFLASCINRPLSIRIEMFRPWKTKKGDIKSSDLDNLLKNETDLIFNSINEWCNLHSLPTLNDKQIYHIEALKKESNEIKVRVELQVYKEIEERHEQI
jgi:Holliday junction resolvase RusA-like endonuclease